MGAVYLIHFSRPYKHAKHYIGFTLQEVAQRIEDHRKGRGARLTAIVVADGIELWLVKVWPDKDRNFERQLKNQKNASKHCMVCRAEKRGKKNV